MTISGKAGVVEGTVLVAGVTENTPEGLLGKVTAVSNDGDATVLTTEPAALTDAIKRCDLHVSATMADGKWNSRVDDRLSNENSGGLFGFLAPKTLRRTRPRSFC